MALPSGLSIEALLAHREWVRALARRLVLHDADVDEIEQLTWVAAMRQPRLAAGTLRAYLARIVRNLALDRARALARRARHEQRAARPEATGSAADTVARAEAHREVVEAVLALDEPYRSALLLRFFEGLPPREIARRLACDVEAVRTRIRRGLERLRQRLGPRMELTLAPLLFVPGLLQRMGILAMSLKKTVAVAALALGIVGGGVALTTGRWATPPAQTRAPGPREREALVELPLSVDPPRAPGLVVQVSRADGRGLRGIRLHRIDGSGAVGEGATADAEGRARFDASDHETTVLACIPGAPVAWAKVPAGATEARLVVAAGATLEGCLFVDGAPPAQPVALSLQWEGGRAIPKPIRNAIQSLGLDADGAACETGGDGTFRFEGIPPTEDAWLAVPADFVLASGGRGCRVSAPGPFVRLEAFALPRLKGRVVFEGGAPVPGALLHAAWTTGERSGHMAVGASPDGRFDFALPELSLRDVALAYADEAAITSATRDLGALGRGVHDLGDLVLAAPREGFLTLRIVDTDGRPVEGAVARAEGAARSRLVVEPADPVAVPAGFVSRPSDPTGPDGTLRLPLCAEPYFARIRARGFEPLGHLVEAAREETLVLRRTTLLGVRVEAAGGRAGIVLRISADRPLFAFETDAYEEAGFSESSSSEEGDWYVWLLDERGEARVPGLGADLPFTVSCLDAFGAALASETVALGNGESRDLLLRVDATARAVRGVVRDASGAPVEGAEVIGWAGAEWARVACGETDAQGRFELEGARTAAVRLLVLSDGFVPRLLEAATDREHAIRLERGRRIRVRIADPHGAPVPDADVRVELDGFKGFPRDFWCGAEIEPGLYEIDGLPAGEVTITVRTREHEARFVHTGEPEGRFVLGSN